MSSLIYLGFSVITFLISYGIVWSLVPMIFGAFFTTLDSSGINLGTWEEAYEKNKENAQFFTPLAASMGVFILILKVGMSATGTGRD